MIIFFRPHNPEQINTFELEIEESPPAPTRYGRQPFKSRSIDDITRIDQHSPQEYGKLSFVRIE